MSYDRSNDSEMGPEPYRVTPRNLQRERERFFERSRKSLKAPSKTRSDVGRFDFQVRAYKSRLRERLAAKYPSPTPAEAHNLEKHIKRLVEIYAQGRVLQQRTQTNRRGRHQTLRTAERSQDNGLGYERG